jgi:nitroreductase / dihydropteridine reductase
MSTFKTTFYNRNTSEAFKLTDKILTPARIFAKSYGLQPFEIIEIDDENIKKELLLEIGSPGHDLDDTHLIVFAIRPVISSEHIDAFLKDIKSAKKMTGRSLNNYRKHIEGILQKSGTNWTSKQAHIALTILAASAGNAGAELSVFDISQTTLFDLKLDLGRQGMTAHIAVKIKLHDSKNPWILSRDNKN